jgi:RNA polymerase sigma-70 factor (sigma-E family)
MKVTAAHEGGGPDTDPAAFDRFYRSTYAASVRLAHLLTGDRWAAEDIVQEAYTRLHGRFRSLDNAAAYLRVCVVNASHSFHRGRGRERARMLRVVEPEAVDPEFRELLDAVDHLPYRQKAVVVLRYYEDLSEAEIAATVGCRPGTVKSLASRALARLGKEIAR